MTQFALQPKWMDNDPMSQKTMSLLESGLETEHSMSQANTDHNGLVIIEMNKTNNLNKKSSPQ